MPFPITFQIGKHEFEESISSPLMWEILESISLKKEKIK